MPKDTSSPDSQRGANAPAPIPLARYRSRPVSAELQQLEAALAWLDVELVAVDGHGAQPIAIARAYPSGYRVVAVDSRLTGPALLAAVFAALAKAGRQGGYRPAYATAR